jgi:glutathione S-transferase
MQFNDIAQLIKMPGLRLVLVQGTPSPWGQAAKAMMEFKRLEFALGAQIPGGDNAVLVQWSGINSGPVVAWNDERPLNRWNDILFLLERLAPAQPLLPDEPALRVQALGLAHEICGELGLGWNRRLSLFQPAMQSGQAPAAIVAMSRKYGYNESDVALATQRQVGMLKHLSSVLDAQRARGSDYFVGARVTAVDFYWAAFSTIFAILPQQQCPIAPGFRPMFETIELEVKDALAANLIEHRDRIMRAYFTLPMEF